MERIAVGHGKDYNREKWPLVWERKSVPGQTQSMAVTETDSLLVRHVQRGQRRRSAGVSSNGLQERLLAFVDSRLRVDRAASIDVVQETFTRLLLDQSAALRLEKRDMEAVPVLDCSTSSWTGSLAGSRGRRPIDQFGSDDYGRPSTRCRSGSRAASSIAERRA